MNIQEGIAKFAGTLVAVLLIIGAVFVVVGIKASSVNWTFVTIGAIALIPCVILLKYTDFKLSAEREDLDKKYALQLAAFKQAADRIVFDLDKARIVKRNRNETLNVVTVDNTTLLDGIIGYGHHDEETIEITACKVTFDIDYQGQPLSFERIIDKDETTLRMRFYMQKETFIYINPEDVNEYLIDLEFLEA